MKRSPASGAISDLLRRLAELVSDPAGRPAGNGPESLLAVIAASCDLRVVPYLLSYLSAERVSIRVAVATALNALLATADDSELVNLDVACRSYGGYPEVWRGFRATLSRSDVLRLAPSEGGVGVLGVVSFHRNGRLREAAVRCLDETGHDRALPFLLIRCNDWVPAVREVATSAVMRRVRSGYECLILRHLRLVIRLERSLRSLNHPVSLAVRGLLRLEGSFEAVREALKSSNPEFRRQVFRWVLDSGPLFQSQLILEGANSADPMIRLWSVRRLPSIAGGPPRIELLMELGKDRFAAVRCEALQQRLVANPEAATGLLSDALMDDHACVRSLARHLIRAMGCAIHIAGIYRGRLSSGSIRTLQTVLLGLGESGDPADVNTVRSFLKAPQSALRGAAIRALAGLDRSGHADVFLSALQDASLRVASEARSALEPLAGDVAEQLRAAYRVEQRPKVQRMLFGLLRSLPFWERGSFLLDALQSQEPAIATRARDLLGLWILRLRTVAIPPKAAELHALRLSLERSKPLLSEAKYNELQFLLQGLS